jgi:hypothetical protein
LGEKAGREQAFGVDRGGVVVAQAELAEQFNGTSRVPPGGGVMLCCRNRSELNFADRSRK